MTRVEKKCKNPECDALIKFSENPKKLFCNLSCKNRFHYLIDTIENAEIISLNKALRTNNKFLLNLIEKGVFEINANAACALGFQKNVFMDIKHFNINGIQYVNLRRLKDVYFVYNPIRNVIIIYFFDNEKEVA
jgi:hypothetical protein